MSTAPPPFAPPLEATRTTYLNAGTGLRSWLLTTDHKRIAVLYALAITAFFGLGGVMAFLMRLELLTPPSDLFTIDVYNRLFSAHGIVMVWFFLIPSIPTTLGNFLLPLMIGTRDLAFPRLNLLSFYVFLLGGLFTLAAIAFGGIDTGWTFYTPYSTSFSQTRVFLVVMGIFVMGFSSILTGLNVVVTTHTLRAPGMTWNRLPLFVWSLYATSLIQILATPVLTLTLVLLGMERWLGVGIFDPALGGDPLLFEHLFWFYSHPAVYIMILPGLGVISELITCFSRKRIFGYGWIAGSSLAIAAFGFLVWGHHMFVSGQSVYAGLVFSVLSFVVAIPSAVKVFNWIATLYKGRIYLRTPMLYALGFIGLFVIGGMTGLIVASLAVDVHVHDTYFVVAHFHYIMVGGMLTAYLGGLHFWWPKITGKLYPEGWGIAAAVLIFFGFNLTFLPQFVMGYLGMPRRYGAYAPEFQVYHVLSTAGSTVLGVAYLLPLGYFLWSLKWGPDAGPNPWNATGLEWTVPSPPPPDNFDETPVVRDGPYAYHLEHRQFMDPAEADALAVMERAARGGADDG